MWSFLTLKLANHTGYIKVDWQRVEKDMKKAKEQLKIRKSNQIPTEVKSKAEEVRLHFVSVKPKGVHNFVQKWRRHTRMSAWDGISLPQRHFQRVNLQGSVEGLVTFTGDAGTHVG